MSSRRAFLGAAAAALALPSSVEADPDGSTPGFADPRHGSPPPATTAAARVSARTTVDRSTGSVTVRSVRFRREGGPADEAELVVAAPPVRATLTLDRDATADLRARLAGDRPDGFIEGEVRLWSDAGPDEAAASIAVRGDRLRVETSTTEAVVGLDDELRDDLVGGLAAALDEPAIVEE